MTLSHKQRVFIEEYLQCWNATESVIKAGYKASNRQRASEIGHQLLQKTPVSEEIRRRVEELAMSADEVLIRLAAQARSSLDDFLDDSGKIDLLKARDNNKLHLLHRYSTATKVRGEEVELYSSQKALELLGKAHGLFTDRVIQENRGQIEIVYVNDWRSDEDTST